MHFYSLICTKSVLDTNCRDASRHYVFIKCVTFLGSLIWLKTLSGLFPHGVCVTEMQSFSGTDFFIFSVSVYKWKIWENYLHYFTLTLGIRMAQLSDCKAGRRCSILYRSVTFHLCCHLQTGFGGHPVFSPASTLPGVWSCHLSPMSRLKMSEVFKIPVFQDVTPCRCLEEEWCTNSGCGVIHRKTALHDWHNASNAQSPIQWALRLCETLRHQFCTPSCLWTLL